MNVVSRNAARLLQFRCPDRSRLPQFRWSSTSPSFPCVDAHKARESRLLSSSSSSSAPSTSSAESGPEPPYARPSPTSYKVYHYPKPLALTYGSQLPSFDIAYETWGTLNSNKDNAILLHTGLSASSHAASTKLNPADGWWQKFIGPGKALDTDQFYVICTNVLGGCYGSTGPSSLDPTSSSSPHDATRYGTNFPILSIFDMVSAQFHLLEQLGIDRLYASVGCSMGAMQSLAAGWLHPDRVGKVVSISGSARSSPGSVAMRYAQRSVLMADPNWNKGFYYDGLPPHTGMKLARQIATITYRSGPEWDHRFGRKLRDFPPSSSPPSQNPSQNPNTTPTTPTPTNSIRVPALCPDFLIETYLDHQGEQFCLKYDANSLIYISKAMDLFDMTLPALEGLNLVPPAPAAAPDPTPQQATSGASKPRRTYPPPSAHLSPHPPAHLPSLAAGLSPLANTPALILGVQSDILFPVEQQREVADALRMAGNDNVRYYELGGVWGHDTFLLDVLNVGGAIRGFLS